MAGPIADLTVLDLTRGIAGPYATKLLADFGAEVIKVEPPEGDFARALGPFPGDLPHPERSGTFFFLNTNKRSVVLDLTTGDAREAFTALLGTVDAVVESFSPGTLDRLGLGWEFIHGCRPHLPLISITNFGQHGPYRDYLGSELTLFGFAGEMYTMGRLEREPVKMYGTAALVEAGAAAATAIFAAIRVARQQGIGQHVDFAIADAQIASADRRHATAIAYEFSGRRSTRPELDGRAILADIYPCADGYVELTAAGQRLDRFAAMLGNPEWLQDPKWSAPAALLDPDLVDEFETYLYAWLSERTRREIWDAAREARVLCGPLFSTDELVADPHFRNRGFWEPVDHPDLGTVEIPGRPLIMPASPWQIRNPAPRLGEHTREVLDGLRAPRAIAGAAGRAATPPRLPLEGVRIIDFCVIWAGTFATCLLADLGAEVIKVENPFVMQPMTRGRAHPPPQILQAQPAAGGYPNGELGPRPWNYCPTFVSLYRNKRSMSVDCRRTEGMDILRRLVASADVVIENNATETLDKLGVTYDWLRSINDDIIMVRMPAYGSTGSYSQARALGVHLESVMGHTLLRGYRDLDPTTTTPIFSGDFMAGAQGALAVMMALWHRDRTGSGQLIEMGQAENASAMLFQAYMDYALNRRIHERFGNRSVYGFAPYGVYPCRPAGPASEGLDRWIAITVLTDAQWQALRTVMGDPEWARDPTLDTRDGRFQQQDLLDPRIAAWTAPWDDYELFHALQAAGVPAAPVLEASRTFDDPHVRARRMYEAHPLFDGVGTFRFVGPFYKFPETPTGIRRAPVAMGQDNDYVYRQVIGVSDEEYAALTAAGHISMDFDHALP